MGTYTVILTVSDNNFSKTTAIIYLEVELYGGGSSDGISSGPQNQWSHYMAAAIACGILSIFFVTYGTEAGRYRFLGFLVPLYTKLKKEEILDDFTRGKIYGYITANPGDHYNSIKKALKLSDGSFAHHIHILEKEGIVKSARDGIHRRFYPSEMRIPDNGGFLKKSQVLIIEIIRETPGISQKEIASLLGVSSATANYHLKELIEQGIVKAERAGMRMRYYVNSHKDGTGVEVIPGEKLKRPQEKKYIEMG
jgi:DNA-binding MarR family transcriptional regulator